MDDEQGVFGEALTRCTELGRLIAAKKAVQVAKLLARGVKHVHFDTNQVTHSVERVRFELYEGGEICFSAAGSKVVDNLGSLNEDIKDLENRRNDLSKRHHILPA